VKAETINIHTGDLATDKHRLYTEKRK